MNELTLRLKKIFSSPLQVFVITASIVGVVSAIIFPPFQVPDEHTHFFRAYQISTGEITSRVVEGKDIGGFVEPIPESKNYYQSSLSGRVFASFPTTASYSPIGYIPQSIGIGLARTLQLPFGYLILFGRVLNLFTFICLISLAIYFAPSKKWVYVVLALFPIVVQQAASLSIDTIVIGTSFLLIAYTHKLFCEKGAISLKDFIIISGTLTIIALTKYNGLILMLPILLLPKAKFETLKTRFMFTIGVVGIPMMALAIWQLLIYYLGYSTVDVYKLIGLNNVSQIGQIKYVLARPLSFIKVMVRSYIIENPNNSATSDFYVVSAHSYFSTFTYRLPLSSVILGYLTLLMAFIKGGLYEKKVKSLVYIDTMIFLFSIIFIGLILYMVWTPVGYLRIEGVQGRYFIPFVPLLIPLFTYLNRWVRLETKREYYFGLFIFTASTINLVAMITLTYIWFK